VASGAQGMSLWRVPVEEKVRPMFSGCVGERGRERDQRGECGGALLHRYQRLSAVETVSSGDEILPDGVAFGLDSRGRWERGLWPH
jgi:hypothetical protein